ncbi:MAG: signal recognition particle protein [Candidatus Ureaplasma intestinipullorum]|uniref:Signal recognition particle protein n=1 Tax=Candidatus Ureaplasma intestinipullorum TaxID=2838770 RepID=A0A9E2KWN1_9BACT|nr:signal recognition particle protein [Candidatus Ureaplasma intestinipullorum]
MKLNGLIGNIVAKRMAKKLKTSAITEDDVRDLLREIRIALLDSDVNLLVVKNFINNIKTKVIGQIIGENEKPSDFVLRVIKEELIEIFGREHKEININKKQPRIMLVGLQGSGKTTTAAKLANFYKNKYDKNPLLVAADIYRPAAIEQLRVLADEVNVNFYQNGTKNAAEIVSEALEIAKNNNDFIIVDTAGRLQTNTELMEELVEIKKVYDPDEILLVVDAMAGQDIINVAEEFNKYLKLTGLIITKLDSDARAGATLSLTSLIKVPIKFTGIGEKIGSLDVFYPDRMADRILGLGDIMTLAEKAADVYDEKQARNAMQRMLSGKMDLEDLMKQMEQLNKMGSLSGLMKMMPTKLNDKISENKLNEMEEKMKVWKILLSSMTLKERRNPRLFKKYPSRKLRVVKGSGRNMDELNKLLKQWELARDKMADAGKMLQSGKNPFGKNGFKNF